MVGSCYIVDDTATGDSPMRPIIALAALLLLAAPAAAQTSAVGGVEGMLGFPGGFENDGVSDTENTKFREGDLSTSFGLIPWVEKKLGDVVGFGGEMMFVWMQSDYEDESRLVLSPHARIRMSFPIIDKVTADAFLAGGATIWTPVEDTATGDKTDGWRVGWSMRFGFGGSYAINDTVSVYGHLGWYFTQTFGDDITASMNTVPLCVGLRGNF